MSVSSKHSQDRQELVSVLTAVAVYEIGGGIAGLVAAVTLRADSVSVPFVGIVAWTGAPFLALILAGLLLLRKKSIGRSLSILLQALQVPIVILPAAVWKFVGGLFVGPQLSDAGLELRAALDVTFIAGRSPYLSLPQFIGINVAPIVVLAVLLLHRLGEQRKSGSRQVRD